MCWRAGCGVCNGPGETECGCTDIPAGDCDCNGNQEDALGVLRHMPLMLMLTAFATTRTIVWRRCSGVCNGPCAADADADGICDDVECWRADVLVFAMGHVLLMLMPMAFARR